MKKKEKRKANFLSEIGIVVDSVDPRPTVKAFVT